MAAYFFDSSSLVKRYTKETGSKWVINLHRSSAGNRLYIVRIAGAEMVAAFTRKNRTGDISLTVMNKAVKRFEREYRNKLLLVEVTPAIVLRAMELAKKYPLRGYDSVQLATGIITNERRVRNGGSPLTFISADNNLNTAATGEGLTVDNPNNHP